MAKILQIFVTTVFTSLSLVPHNISATHGLLGRLNGTVAGKLLCEGKGMYLLKKNIINIYK